MFACPATDDFFRSLIGHMIDLRHPPAVLASRMPWQQVEASVAHLFTRNARTGQSMPDLDLFGEAPAPAARASKAGRPPSLSHLQTLRWVKMMAKSYRKGNASTV